MIAITDLDVGQVEEIGRALRAAGAVDVRVTADPKEVRAARAVVLGGVADFDDAARALHARGLDAAVRAARAAGAPVLAIGVGMQLLFEGRVDGAGEAGLGFYCGGVRRSARDRSGWRTVRLDAAHPWLAELPARGELFFAQPDAVEVEDDVVLATTEGDAPIPAAVGGESLLGVQFDPHRSGAAGACLLAAFVRDVTG